MIHHAECGDCKSGEGKRSRSNHRGFWAGPFENEMEIEEALKELQKLTISKFKYERCSRCFKA